MSRIARLGRWLGLMGVAIAAASCGGSSSADCSCLEGIEHPYEMGVIVEQCMVVEDTRPGLDPYVHCDCKARGSGVPKTNIETCESLRMQGRVP